MRNLTPSEFYQAYPDSDLLCIEPPPSDLNGPEFLQAVETSFATGELSDTLFLFFARELYGEPLEPHETYDRILRAENDAHALLEAMENSK